MTAITVIPAALVDAAARIGHAGDAVRPTPADLAAAAESAAFCGDAGVAAAIGEFVAAWGQALPALLNAVTQLGSALDGAVELYVDTDTAAAGHDH
jgi:uncharacterized protein YukE